MKFTEAKAKELQVKFDLNNSIINKWRYRGSIPDKYNKKYSAEDKAHKLLCKRIVDVLEKGFINRALLCEMTNTFTKNTYTGNFTKEQAKAIRKELMQIKIDIAKTFKTGTEAAFKKLISDERIFLKKVIDDSLYYNRCIKFKNNNTFLDAETLNYAKDKYLIAAITISL